MGGRLIEVPLYITISLMIIIIIKLMVLFLVGCRISQVSLLCGGIVPIMSTLEWVMARNADKLGIT